MGLTITSVPQCYSENKVRNSVCYCGICWAQQGIEKLNRQVLPGRGSRIVQKTRLRPEKLQYKEAQMKCKEKSNSGKRI